MRRTHVVKEDDDADVLLTISFWEQLVLSAGVANGCDSTKAMGFLFISQEDSVMNEYN